MPWGSLRALKKVSETFGTWKKLHKNPASPGRGRGSLFLLSPQPLTLPGFCVADSQLAECRGPPEVEGAPLFSLTEESFKACHLTLTLDDYLFIAFVGFVVSIASVATNFLLGITANCCHRWSKASEEEEVWPGYLHAADHRAPSLAAHSGSAPARVGSQVMARARSGNYLCVSFYGGPDTVLGTGTDLHLAPQGTYLW